MARQSLWRRRAAKNVELFDILNSCNMLSARCLQKRSETSIYKNAEIRKASAVAAPPFAAAATADDIAIRTGKAEMALKNLTADGTDFTAARKSYGKQGKPRTRERREKSR